MNKSDTIGQLAEALSALQGEIKDPTKNRSSHNNRYADLPQILDVIRPLMLKNGLSIAQLTGSANEMVSVETVLMHKSGEWISSTIEMPVMDQKGTNSAQSVGIIITYARRYAITAMFGICAQDDSDGNATSTAGKLITGVERDAIFKACNNNKDKIEGIMKWANISNINDLTLDKYTEVINNIKIQSMKEKNDVV